MTRRILFHPAFLYFMLAASAMFAWAGLVYSQSAAPALLYIRSAPVNPNSAPVATVNGTSATLDWVTGGDTSDSWVYYGTTPPTWAAMSISASTFYDVAHSIPDRAWVVGESGRIWRTLNASGTPPNWQQQLSGTSNTLRAVSAASRDIVWAVGDAGTIRYTNNGGNTWSSQSSPLGAGVNLLGVTAVDDQEAWAVSEDGRVLQTTNAGANWTSLIQLNTAPLRDIEFKKTSTGSIYGCIAGDGGLLALYDGSATIKNITLSPATANDFYSCSIAPEGDKTGLWGVGEGGIAYHTSVLTSQTATGYVLSGIDLYKIVTYKGERVFAAGKNGLILYTDDAGSNWDSVALGTGDFFSIAMADPLRVWAVGSGEHFQYRGQYGTSQYNGTLTSNHSIALTGLQPTTTYNFSVSSTNSAGTGYVRSANYTFETGFADSTPPVWPSPQLAAAETCSGSSAYANLTWASDASDAESDIDHYDVQAQVNGAAFQSVGTIDPADIPPRSFSYGPLATSTSYVFKILAVNGEGLATESNTASLTTGTKTFDIAWLDPRDVSVTIGDPAQHGLGITRYECFSETVNVSFVGATKPASGANAMTSGMVSFGAENLGIIPMNTTTGALSVGTYSDIRVSASSATIGPKIPATPNATLTVEATDPTPPSAPALSSFLQCNGTAREVQLSWTPAIDNQTGISKYEVYRRIQGQSTWNLLITLLPSQTGYTDTTAAPDTFYEYKVTAYNNGTPPLPVDSNLITADTSAAGCDNDTTPPSDVSLNATLQCNASKNTDVVLAWSASSDAESRIDHYAIYRDGGQITTVPGGQTTYTDANVPFGPHTYEVSATNDATPPLTSARVQVMVTVEANGVSADVTSPAGKSATVASGDTALYTVTVSPTGCFDENVTLTFDGYAGPPAAIAPAQVNFNPATLNPATGTGESIMSINTAGLGTGTYQPLGITATGTTGSATVPQTPNPVTLIIDASLCTDGTPNLTCKATVSGNNADLPLYCDTSAGPAVADNCSECGCPTSLPYCNASTGSCEANCTDGTPDRSCSTANPGFYCDLATSINAVEDCVACGVNGPNTCSAANAYCESGTRQCVVDAAPPLLSCPITCTPSTDSITVSWCTDEPASSGVRWGQMSGFWPDFIEDPLLVADHALTVTGLLSDTNYYYQVFGQDQFGNLFTSTEQSCKTEQVVDVTPPTCAITAPAPPGAVVSGTVDFTADATDDIGVVQVEFRAGGAVVGTDSGSPYGVLLDTTPYPDGDLIIGITAQDGSGNTCNDEYTITVANDNQAPQLTSEIKVTPFGGGTSVRVQWSTDEQSSGYVAYGIEGTVQGNWTQVSYPLGNPHEVDLPGLQVGQQYAAVIQACDTKGNCGFLNL